MKTILKIALLLMVFQGAMANEKNNNSSMSEGGILIKAIHLTKFPNGRNGKNFDKNNYPDLYARLYVDRKKKAKSNVSKECRKGRIPILTGGNLPFRIEQNTLYHIQILDHDSDRGIGSNPDDEVSSMIEISHKGLISKYGKKKNYLIKDPVYNDVQFLLVVEHVGAASVAGKNAYIKYVKPIDQKYVAPKNKVLEGCGPVAATMIMGYWQTEHGYQLMNPADRFNGTKHPTKTILDFRKKADSRAWGDQEQTATRKTKMKDALEFYTREANKKAYNKPKLKVDIMWSIRRWNEKKQRLKKELWEGSPVIMLLKKLPPCLKGKWVDATKVVADHYVVAVGYNDARKEYYVLPGWEEKPKINSWGPAVHKAQNKAHCKCSYSEIAAADPSLIWIKR